MYTGETKISLWGPYTANLVYFSGLVVFSWFILRGKRIIWVFCLGVVEAAYEVFFVVCILIKRTFWIGIQQIYVYIVLTNMFSY